VVAVSFASMGIDADSVFRREADALATGSR
jgi:hypothetical protein